jgi:putative ATPase
MKKLPLAAALRPKTIDEVIGQDHLTDKGMPLRQMLEKGLFKSAIIWGPPGTGKTSLVTALASQSGSSYIKLNATEATIKDLRKVISEAAARDSHTFVFVDEIHRWNKSQQDTMLPSVEDGTITLFGATTENPRFAVNSTILSRCIIMEAKPLNAKSASQLMLKVKDYYKEHGKIVKIQQDAAKTIINRSSGDARKLITALETCIEILSDDGNVTLDMVNIAIPDKHLVFDATGNDHYDLAHCYQEAIQNSDGDSAIYWLAKWLSSGEDPAYICRRMLITAFEDCAANPHAVTTTMAACYTVEKTGMPECMIPMALATCVMAQSERSKYAYFAIKEAMSDVANNATVHVPPALRAGTRGYVKAINKVYIKNYDDYAE